MDNPSISLRLKKITFHKEYFILTDVQERKYRISYEELIFVYLEVYSAEPGERRRIRPALEDITEDMDGELFMLDSRQCRWNLQTDLSSKKAGAILKELGIYAPYILLGGQTWLKEEDDFEQARIMVQIMKESEKIK